jgi:MFS family permease
MGAGLAQNIETFAICRFFAGLFGSPPQVTFGGTMSDMWAPIERTYVFPISCAPAFVGAFLAPPIADFIATSPYVDFHWTEWVTLIFAGIIVLSITLFVPETYTPTLLAWRAKHIRTMTGDDRYRAAAEVQRQSLARRLMLSIGRPIKILLAEPIVDLFALYLVVSYVIMFGFLPGYEYIFGGIYGFDQLHAGLCYLGMNVGFLLAMVPVPFLYKRYLRKIDEARNAGSRDGKVEPEERLLIAMLGAPILPISIFWMSWTSWPSASFWSPIIASVFFGFAVLAVFISSYQYAIDAFESYAASALVGMTITRYGAAGTTLPSLPMLD